ncbi:MAG: phosphotransacetylase family protein [Clostridiales bacterium]|jgi:BioD-like phosphotransacetylase family protein|nr:phosphotransacetylase family protein [Clostridiales bacterium]
MKSLFISGMAGSGKTAIALGLALKLQEQGKNIGYFKPLSSAKGPGSRTDEDILLFKQVLSLTQKEELLAPVKTGPYYLSVGARRDPAELTKKIQSAFEEIAAAADVVIIDGYLSPYSAAGKGLDSIRLAKMFNSAMIYVARVDDDHSLDKMISYNEYFKLAGVNLLGSIFNNVERTLLDKTRGIYAPILEEFNHTLLGIIPKKPEIAAPTVREYFEALGGELLTGEIGMDGLVEDVLVGSMTIESALGYLRRAPNKAVITGGDRSDMAVTALETSTSVLILTGGLYPDVGVLARAIEKKVPVILVHYDTFTTIERLHEVTRRIHPGDEQGIEIAKSNINDHCRWQSILDYINS